MKIVKLRATTNRALVIGIYQKIAKGWTVSGNVRKTFMGWWKAKLTKI